MTPYYITTPIFYVNGDPHIGHAYTAIAADVLARFKRLDGYDVHFLSGTDEHGQKVEKAARDAGLEPQAFTDEISAKFRAMEALLGVSTDDFIRTTEERHKDGTSALWRLLRERDQIYPGHYEGWYAVRDEDFYSADELTILPDGSRLAPTGAPVEWVREPNYLFRLSQWQEPLLRHYEENPDFVGPGGKRNEMLSFIRGGLNDLSVSRSSFTWGIPVPDDPGHVMYVWLDALANYITALGYPDTAAAEWRYWPADLHLVGKDIQRFHAVYWPAFLMAAGLPVPKRIFAHGWWTVEGAKMSKSVGNVVDPLALVRRYGLDPVRFFLLREVPFGNDGDFSERALVARLNTELANDFGNLAQRSLSLIAKNCDGKLPARGEPTEDDAFMLEQAAALAGLLRSCIDRQALHEGLEEIWKVIRAANSYIDRQAPWALRKTDPARMAAVLRVLADVVRSAATLLQPYMPESMGRMLDQLGVPADARTVAALAYPLPAGTVLPVPQGVFPRYVEEAA
ncbi:MAG: methionine--tRNA ligase [Rhodospirillales bacterium]